jgi:Protein of unknown function (DUF4199)
MTALVLRYGTIAGLIVAIYLIGFMLTADASDQEPLGGMVITYLVMLVALTAVFLGVKSYRDRVLGGVIRFLPAFGLGLAISVVACLFYTVAWEISLAYSDFDISRHLTDWFVEAARAKGASAEEMAKALADAKAFNVKYANPFFRMPLTFVEMFPVGLLVSLVTAAILRNSRVLPARASAG